MGGGCVVDGWVDGFGRWMYCLGFGMNFCVRFVWGLG